MLRVLVPWPPSPTNLECPSGQSSSRQEHPGNGRPSKKLRAGLSWNVSMAPATAWGRAMDAEAPMAGNYGPDKDSARCTPPGRDGALGAVGGCGKS